MLDTYPIILAVGTFIRNSKNQLLIVKKSPFEKVDGGLWTIPGGKVRQNEPITDALKRETEEEVGLTITAFKWLGEDVFMNNNYWFHGQHFLCKVEKNSPVILEHTLLEYKWILQNELVSYEFHPNIKKRLKEIFTFMTQEFTKT